MGWVGPRIAFPGLICSMFLAPCFCCWPHAACCILRAAGCMSIDVLPYCNTGRCRRHATYRALSLVSGSLHSGRILFTGSLHCYYLRLPVVRCSLVAACLLQCGVTRWVTDLQVSVSRIGVGTRRFWGTNAGFTPAIKTERIQFVAPMPSSTEQAEMELERALYRHSW